MPDNLWCRCPNCSEMLFSKELGGNIQLCPKCDYHFPLSVQERLDLMVDAGSYEALVDVVDDARLGTCRIGKHAVVLLICPQETPQALQLFVHAARHALEHRLPLVSVYASTRSGARNTWALTYAAEDLSHHAIPHISTIVAPSPDFGYLTCFPPGDVLLAEPVKQPPVPPSGSVLAQAEVRPPIVLPGQEMIDRFVDRRECSSTLQALLAFFGSSGSR